MHSKSSPQIEGLNPVRHSLLVLALSLSPIAAQAQLEEVLVTATKRSASVQDIPMSISQIDGDALSERGITNIENLSYQVPNLQFGTFGQTTFVTIRGIGTTVDSGVAEPAVATYVDGVFLPRATMGILTWIPAQCVVSLSPILWVTSAPQSPPWAAKRS